MNNIPYPFGTQYYRAPTPLPGEWKHDFGNFEKLGLNLIQLRVQWRVNERKRDEYNFEDIDRLMEIAAQSRQRVIIKFMLETAPDYLFHELNGYRIDLNGTIIKPFANGAFYAGGKQPCFDHPEVMARAVKFTQTVVRRYHTCEHLLLWNVWNEPRTSPVSDCCCNHSVAAYRKYLETYFGTIENLNRQFGKYWESFEMISPPGSCQDYAEFFLWRLWAVQRLSHRLAIFKKTVSDLDPVRSVIAHCGCASVINDAAGDGTDDFINAQNFDFYGTSFPVGDQFQTPLDIARPFLLCDWLRHCSKNFWVYEIYPEWGNWGEKITVNNFRFKVLSAIAGGSKGLLFWQYRAERLGHENDLAGLVNIDGSFKSVSEECRKLGKSVKKHGRAWQKAEVIHDRIGLIYDLHSDMISRIEASEGKGFGFVRTGPGGCYFYKDNFHGIYTMLNELNLTPLLIDSRNLARHIHEVDVLYLPEYFIVSEKNQALLLDFAISGGRIIAEEGLALRQSNTWLNYPWPGLQFKHLFGIQIATRTATAKSSSPLSVSVNGASIEANGFAATLIPEQEVEISGYWNNGMAAITRKNEAFFLGVSLGNIAFWHYMRQANPLYESAPLNVLKYLLQDRLPLPDLPPQVYQRRLRSPDGDYVFLFNRSGVKKYLNFNGSDISIEPYDSAIHLMSDD